MVDHSVLPSKPAPFPCRVLIVSLLILAHLILPLTCRASAAAAQEEHYTMGVFPFLPMPTLEGIFAPIAAELSRALGRPVRLQSASSFDKFTANLERQQYDIAHIHPFEYVLTGAKAGYVPVVTRTEKLKTVFAVTNESPLRAPRDLKGKVIGLPPENASVSYLAKVALIRSGLKPGRDFAVKHFSTHQSCLQQLLIGNIVSCATSPPALRLFEPQPQKPFRTILSSPEIPQTLFVVHRRIPAAQREAIKKALVQSRLPGIDPALRKLFIHKETGTEGYFRSVSDKDYDNVRSYLKLIGKQ